MFEYPTLNFNSTAVLFEDNKVNRTNVVVGVSLTVNTYKELAICG